MIHDLLSCLDHSSSHLLSSSHSGLSLTGTLRPGLLCSFSLPETSLIMSISFHPVLSSFHSYLFPQTFPWLQPSSPSGICANVISSKKPSLSTQSKEVYFQSSIILHLITHFLLFIVLTSIQMYHAYVFVYLLTGHLLLGCKLHQRRNSICLVH